MNYIDMGGVENVSVALIRHAKKDFIKGAKYLYGKIGCVPTLNELLKYSDPKIINLSNNQDVRWMYDSWRFVRDDPYVMFSGVGEESVIKSWISEAIIQFHKELYIPTATVLYGSLDNLDKELYKLSDSKLKKAVGDESINDFIKARNYISKLTDWKSILDEWDSIAYERHKRLKKNPNAKQRVKIQETDFAKSKQLAKLENIKKAKEMKDNGLTISQIAEKLGVTYSCAYHYLYYS